MTKRSADKKSADDKGQLGDVQLSFDHGRASLRIEPDKGAITSGNDPVSSARKKKPSKAKIGTGQEGHRSRLRERFMKGDEAALPDYELLEMVLFRALPRRDTKALAKLLLNKFGSFAEVINAPANRLCEVKGVGDRVVTEFKLVRAAALRLMKSEIISRPPMSSWENVIQYIHAAQAYEEREQFRILFLDKKNQLIADEIQGQGTVDHTPVYIREVVKRSLELNASALVLVHNHPSGDPTPSRADIDMTKLIVAAAKPLGVVVHDHIIVGRSGHASFKALRLL